jgi:hypothetical protein
VAILFLGCSGYPNYEDPRGRSLVNNLDWPSVTPPKEIDMGIPLAHDSTLVAIAEDSNDWTQPYVAYHKHKILPKDEAEARMIVQHYKSSY